MQARSPNNPKGLDLSHYQSSNIDWAQVKAAEISFVILKATEGQSMIDDCFKANLTGAKAAGLAIGAYHFCRAKNISEALLEVAFFINVIESVGGIHAFNIPPCLDIETAEAGQQVPLVAHMWLDTIEQHYGIKPMIYTYPWFANTYLSDPSFAAYKLHYAYYEDGIPPDAGAWKEWTFLQISERGTVPGIGAPCDLNIFAGSEWELLYQLKPEDANAMIERWVAHEYDLASDADKAERHRLANELRKASGQAEQSPK